MEQSQQDPGAQAQQLVAEVKSTPPPPSDPQKGGDDAGEQLPKDFNAQQFNETLKAVTGIEDYTKIPELKSQVSTYQQQIDDYKANLAELQNSVTQYKAKANLNPYANPLVEEINNFFQSERSESEIRRFLSLHSKDVEGMDYTDAIMQKLALENPHLDEGDLSVLLEDQFGEVPTISPDMTDEERAKAERVQSRINAKLKVAGKEAKEWLKSQRKSFDNPEVQAQRQAQSAQLEKYQNAWSEVASEIVNVETVLNYEQESKDFGKYSHPGFKPNLSDEQKGQLTELIKNYAVQNNLPLTKESLPALTEYKEAILWNMQREEFLSSLLRDFHAEIASYYMKLNANAKPIQQGSPPRQEAPKRPKSQFPQPEGGVGKNQFF